MAPRKWKKLGRRLRLLRHLTGLTQTELTNRLADYNLLIDHTLISKYERGERKPDRERLLILLSFFAIALVLESPQETNEILRLAGYNSLSPKEGKSLFEGRVTAPDLGTSTSDEIEIRDDFASPQGSEIRPYPPPSDDQHHPIREPRFDYLFVQGPGYFWPQLGKPWPFHSLSDKFLTVRKTPEEHESAKFALILTESGTIMLILVGIAMMVVLFMPPLGTHGEDQIFAVPPVISDQNQGYAARVIWAIKIILGFLMLFLIISRWWTLPLLKFVFQVRTGNGARN